MTGRRFDSQTCGSNRRSILGQFGFDFWASTPVCDPAPNHRDRTQILPWASPLAGLSGTWLCIRRGSTPHRITSPRSPTARHFRAAAQLQSAHGFKATPSRRVPTRGRPVPRDLLVKVTSSSSRVAPDACMPARFRRPFSVLMGLMPRSSRRLRAPAGELPV